MQRDVRKGTLEKPAKLAHYGRRVWTILVRGPKGIRSEAHPDSVRTFIDYNAGAVYLNKMIDREGIVRSTAIGGKIVGRAVLLPKYRKMIQNTCVFATGKVK